MDPMECTDIQAESSDPPSQGSEDMNASSELAKGISGDSSDQCDVEKSSNFGTLKKARINKAKNVNLDEMSKEELISKVKVLERHVQQLRNIIAKVDNPNKKGKGRKDRSQRPLDFSKYNTRHVALKVLYLGWDYRGYAVQEDSDKTIEHHLFDVLLKTKLIESRETSNYHRCGRTDKGVSAFSQVVSIDLRTNLLEGVGVKVKENGTAHERPGDKTEEINYVHIMNKVLPSEIRVISWCPVDPDFSARFSCRRRTYKYVFPKGSLNIDCMNEAAANLLGEHDFRNLCKMDVQNGVVNYMRNITHAKIRAVGIDTCGYQLYELTVVGQAFLWHQIRCIVAVLLLVGQDKEDPSVITELLNVEKNPCKPQYTMASELPLVLFGSEYFNDNVKWVYNEECHVDLIKHLQEQWAMQSVKSSITRRMLDEISYSYANKIIEDKIHCPEVKDEILVGVNSDIVQKKVETGNDEVIKEENRGTAQIKVETVNDENVKEESNVTAHVKVETSNKEIVKGKNSDTVQGMAESEHKNASGVVLNQSEFLLAGSKAREYIPLLKRDKGESLEGRIQHFTKRRKIILE